MDSSPLDARTRRHLIALLFFAFVVRLAVLLYFQTYAVPGPEAWGHETGRISRSLAEGRGFSSPFEAETGPTAWFPPLHPFLQAVAFKLFGIQSIASAFVMRLFNILCDLGTCWILFKLASRLWGTAFGFICAWVWAIFPAALWIDTTLVSYASLSLFLFLCALYSALVHRFSQNWDWAVQGLLWGTIALTNPTLLLLLPPSWLFVWLRVDDRKAASRGFVLSSFILIMIVAPWTVRNYFAFKALIPVRGNFGHELFKGNHWGATGENDYMLNPEDNPAELKEFVRLGERQYVQQHKKVATSFIRENPSGFFRLTRRRIFLFWSMPNLGGMFDFDPFWHRVLYLALSCTGLLGVMAALLKSRRERTSARTYGGGMLSLVSDPAWFFALVVLIYPLPYYVTFPNARYRYLIEPILVIFSLHLITGFRFSRTLSGKGKPLIESHPVAPIPYAVSSVELNCG